MVSQALARFRAESSGENLFDTRWRSSRLSSDNPGMLFLLLLL